jgi:hypothetical protein
MRLKALIVTMMDDGDPYVNPPEELMKELTEDAQPKERAARKALAEAVAVELGHRKLESRLQIFRR